MEANPSLRIDGTTLKHTVSTGAIAWTLPIEAIVLIAEYTTNEGPYVDDYFLIFVTVEDGKVFNSTCVSYAEGINDVLLSFSRRVGSPVELGLVRSTEWASRVIWPPSLADQEYFTFKKVQPKNAFQKLKRWMLGSQLEFRVSDLVRNFINAQTGV